MLSLCLPDALPRSIEAWLLPLDLTAPVAAEDWKLLDEGERARAQSLARHQDRVRTVATRAALRKRLAAHLQREPTSLQFESGPNGKPRLAEARAPAFNVSHSGSYALIAISASDEVATLGVDIERHSAGLGLDALAEYAFTASEREFLHVCRNPDGEIPLPFFFRSWVAKEAALKAVGVGISEHLHRVSVHSCTGGRLQVRHDMDGWLPLHGHDLEAPENYSAAIAWQVAEAA